MNNINVTISGNGRTLHLQNPILTAAGTFGYGKEYKNFGDVSSIGAIISKAITLNPNDGNPMPRIAETKSGLLNSVGQDNCGIDFFLKRYLPEIVEDNISFITNIYGNSVLEYKELASKINDSSDILGIEISTLCPNFPNINNSQDISVNYIKDIVKTVVKEVKDKPIIVKLSPNINNISEVAKICEEEGANMISCIGTISGMAINLKNKKPRLGTILGGLSGPAIKPIAMRCVWEVYQKVKIPVIGIGGIQSIEDVLEFMIAGASAVQIGTANFTSPDIAFKLIKELPEAMNKYNIQSLKDLVGSLELD